MNVTWRCDICVHVFAPQVVRMGQRQSTDVSRLMAQQVHPLSAGVSDAVYWNGRFSGEAMQTTRSYPIVHPQCLHFVMKSWSTTWPYPSRDGVRWKVIDIPLEQRLETSSSTSWWYSNGDSNSTPSSIALSTTSWPRTAMTSRHRTSSAEQSSGRSFCFSRRFLARLLSPFTPFFPISRGLFTAGSSISEAGRVWTCPAFGESVIGVWCPGLSKDRECAGA